MSQGRLRADFSVTLSVHNASETRPWLAASAADIMLSSAKADRLRWSERTEQQESRMPGLLNEKIERGANVHDISSTI